MSCILGHLQIPYNPYNLEEELRKSITFPLHYEDISDYKGAT
jgi:hypothetical protein